ncbi:uncharacterized protein LOC123321945 [Coccinella septempunctata]|uniref:uncharacterized protein LOC123321945 n=1 Tax=Coccinella septempunctata TaxID=41139 RepID=UPI001D07EF37|nr:uncharacterized protein LOC123321945 [Coccinella septempunctata]
MQNKYNDLHQCTSTTQLKNKIKERFLSTLKEVRRKSVDARRFASTSVSEKAPTKIYSMKDLRNTLSNKDLKELISPEEIDEIFAEVQQEIGWKEEEEIDLHHAEIQAVIENLITYCIICDEASEKEICQSCGNKHFTESL